MVRASRGHRRGGELRRCLAGRPRPVSFLRGPAPPPPPLLQKGGAGGVALAAYFRAPPPLVRPAGGDAYTPAVDRGFTDLAARRRGELARLAAALAHHRAAAALA